MAQSETETYKMYLFESQNLFCKGAGTVGVTAISTLN